jgi:hypothetical protein
MIRLTCGAETADFDNLQLAAFKAVQFHRIHGPNTVTFHRVKQAQAPALVKAIEQMLW